MPQVHNKSLVMEKDVSAFGKHSRAGASMRLTENSMKRIEAVNGLEQKLSKISLNYFERHADIHKRKYERIRQRLLTKLNRNMAYKMVLKTHSVARAKDYEKALDGNYSFHALRHKVRDMIEYMKPEIARERHTRNLISENNERYEKIIRENKERMFAIFPAKKSWDAFDFNKGKTDEEDEDENDDANGEDENKDTTRSCPPKLGLGRGPPLTTRLPLQRQTISMSMMKKQKSFLETQEQLTPRFSEETPAKSPNPPPVATPTRKSPMFPDLVNTEKQTLSEGPSKEKETDTIVALKPLKSVGITQNGKSKRPRQARHSITLPPLQLKNMPTERQTISSLR